MLKSSDLQAAMALAAQAAACETVDDVRRVLLPALAHLLHADLASYDQVVLDRLRQVDMWWPATAVGEADLEGCAAVMPERPVVADQVTGVLGVRRGCLHSVVVSRWDRAFSHGERALFDLLRPHLAATVRRALASPQEHLAGRLAPHPRLDRRPGVELEHGTVDGSPPLTAREHDVLRLLAHGLSSAQCARRLGISARTVEKHLEHVHAKLGVTNRVEALTRAGELAVGTSAAAAPLTTTTADAGVCSSCRLVELGVRQGRTGSRRGRVFVVEEVEVEVRQAVT